MTGVGNFAHRPRGQPLAAERRLRPFAGPKSSGKVRPEGVALKTFAGRCSGRRKADIHSGTCQLTAACRATPLPLSDPRYRPRGEPRQSEGCVLMTRSGPTRPSVSPCWLSTDGCDRISLRRASLTRKIAPNRRRIWGMSAPRRTQTGGSHEIITSSPRCRRRARARRAGFDPIRTRPIG